jgi:diguanylate cyclase (GGDEF)-like protein/PAS domain S-box-containing protein
MNTPEAVTPTAAAEPAKRRDRRLPWLPLVVGLLTVGGLLGYLLWSEYRVALRTAETTGHNLSGIIEARLDATLRRSDAVLQVLVRSLPASAMQPAEAPRHARQFDAELDARAAHFPELAGLRVFDAHGALLYASGRDQLKEAAHVDDREFFRVLRDDPALERTYSDAFVPRSTGTHAFAIVYPIRGARGEFLGVTLALINLDYFQNLLDDLDIGPRGLVSIRRGPELSLLLRRPLLANEINKPLLPDNPIRQSIAAGNKEAVLRFTAQTDRIPRIFYTRALEFHPFYVQVAIAEADALADWRGRVHLIGMASLLLFGLMAATLWRLARSERREAAMIAGLEANARRFRSLFHEAPMGHALNRLSDGGFVEINIAFAEMTGYGRAELDALSYWDLTPPKFAAEEARQLELLRKTGRYGPYEKEYVRKDGTTIDVRLTGTLYEGEDGEKLILSVVEDISDRKRAEAELRLMANIFEHSGEAILISDRDNRIVAVNPAFTRLTGYAAEEVIGRNPSILASGRSTPEEYAQMWQALREHGLWHGEVWDRRKDGGTYPKWLTIATLKNADGEVTHYIGSFTDISERKTAEEQIRHLAHHDTLTGLSNRFHLQGRLEQALATARRDERPLAVIFLDLDRFKIINDTLGHQVGDHLLIAVAHRLRASVRDSDIVARLGGDEFVVVLTDVEAAGAQQVADKILRSLATAYNVGAHRLHSTPSLGIAMFPQDGDSVEALMKNADTAMYHAKTAGRNNAQFFTAAMNEEASTRLALENSLRQAVARNEFELHYQPQVELASGRVIGVEALVRWHHPERGLLSPLTFIPLAEETGLIVPLGAWVLGQALRQLAAWHAAGIDGLRMAVNLSAHQLRSPTFVSSVAAAIETTGIPPERLELEITESVAMADPQATIELLGQLRRMGIDLAIDDFGTGYSSLSYLKLLPIQRLKLDRSFVMDIEHDPNDAAICSATIALAHSLGLGVIAEGVETEAQRDYLARLGCDNVQGYLFSRPLPAAEAEAFLRHSLLR